jgi:hypothetical protein
MEAVRSSEILVLAYETTASRPEDQNIYDYYTPTAVSHCILDIGTH